MHIFYILITLQTILFSACNSEFIENNADWQKKYHQSEKEKNQLSLFLQNTQQLVDYLNQEKNEILKLKLLQKQKDSIEHNQEKTNLLYQITQLNNKHKQEKDDLADQITELNDQHAQEKANLTNQITNLQNIIDSNFKDFSDDSFNSVVIDSDSSDDSQSEENIQEIIMDISEENLLKIITKIIEKNENNKLKKLLGNEDFKNIIMNIKDPNKIISLLKDKSLSKLVTLVLENHSDEVDELFKFIVMNNKNLTISKIIDIFSQMPNNDKIINTIVDYFDNDLDLKDFSDKLADNIIKLLQINNPNKDIILEKILDDSEIKEKLKQLQDGWFFDGDLSKIIKQIIANPSASAMNLLEFLKDNNPNMKKISKKLKNEINKL